MGFYLRNHVSSLDQPYFVYDDKTIIGGVNYKSEITNGNLELGASICSSINFKVKDTIERCSKYKNRVVRWDYSSNGAVRVVNMGEFVITDIKRIDGSTTEFTAYDPMIYFDKIVDDLINTLKFPMFLTDFAREIVNYCAPPQFQSIDFDFGYSAMFKVNDNFKAIGITGRQILQYIAQLCGGMCFYHHLYRKNENILHILPFGYNTAENAFYHNILSYTPDTYKSLEISDSPILPIDKLVVKVSDDDVGVTAGTGDNIITVENNPLLYTDTVSNIQPTVNQMFDKVKTIAYHTGKVEVFNITGADDAWTCGCYIKVDGKKMMITGIDIKNSGITFTSTGDYKRDNKGSPINSQIVALRGKTNQLTIDIEHTNSTLTDKMSNLESSVNQTAEGLTAEVKKANETASKAEQTANGFSQEITNVKGDVSTLTQTVNGFDTRITNAQGDATTAIQTAQGLTLESTSGTDGKSASIVLKAGGTEQSKADIQFNGLVGFNDLSGAGGTEINGNNITSGTISADRIDVTNIAAGKLQGGYIAIENDDKPAKEIGHMSVTNDPQGEFQNELIIGSKGLFGIEVENELRIGTKQDWDFSYVPEYQGYAPWFAFGGDVTPDRTNRNRYLGDSSHKWDSVWAQTPQIETSDRNQKNSISYDITKYDAFFDKLKPAKFKLNNGTSDRYHIGMIAQDVEQALTECGIDSSEFAGFIKYKDKETKEDGYALRYGEFISLCINKIQTQEKKINDMETRIAELEKLIKK